MRLIIKNEAVCQIPDVDGEGRLVVSVFDRDGRLLMNARLEIELKGSIVVDPSHLTERGREQLRRKLWI